MHGSGAVSCSCSLLIRGLILPAVRQKLHLSPCADSRSRLCRRPTIMRNGAGFHVRRVKGPHSKPEQEKGAPESADEATKDSNAEQSNTRPKEEPKPPRNRRPEFFSSSGFTADFVPPDYVVVGLLQRRFVYSCTGVTGDGK